MNKKSVLITPDVIEECLCESLDILEKRAISLKNTPSHSRIQKSSK